MLEPTRNVPTVIADKLGIGVLLFAYAALLGATYIFGFWRAIGIDVFPFASAIDYVSAPLNRVLVLIAIPLLFALIIFGQTYKKDARLLSRIALYLAMLYSLGFAHEYYNAVRRFAHFDFSYENEKTVLALAAILFVAGLGLTYRVYRTGAGVLQCVFALIVLQLAQTLSAGYSDGKAIFNGAANVFFLDNKDLCEEEGVRDWVFLGKFSDRTFFMNTIDKRLCITGETSYKLTSRKYSEGL